MPQLLKPGDIAPLAFDPSSRPQPTVSVTAPRPAPPKRKRPVVPALAVLGAVAAAAGVYWWEHRAPAIPVGIAWSNGRIEADEIDIETKFAGRVAVLYADEGDRVARGQFVAEMDTRDQEAMLHRDEATALQADKALEEAHANILQQQTSVGLARKQVARRRSSIAAPASGWFGHASSPSPPWPASSWPSL